MKKERNEAKELYVNFKLETDTYNNYNYNNIKNLTCAYTNTDTYIYLNETLNFKNTTCTDMKNYKNTIDKDKQNIKFNFYTNRNDYTLIKH